MRGIEKGKFIVLYAPNNLGKSEQIKKLASYFINNEHEVLVIKYPIYNLKPTGPLIDKYLRTKNQVSESDLQKIFAQNRRDFQPVLKSILNSGITVIAEDYTGTGLAWGLTRGVKLKALQTYNKDLLTPDVSILLDGERFTTKIEKVHRNESAGSAVWRKNRKMHLYLAKKYRWKTINANQTITKVHKDILGLINNIDSL